MGTTTKYGLRYPELADPPTVQQDLKNLATDVDTKVLGLPTVVNGQWVKGVGGAAVWTPITSADISGADPRLLANGVYASDWSAATENGWYWGDSSSSNQPNPAGDFLVGFVTVSESGGAIYQRVCSYWDFVSGSGVAPRIWHRAQVMGTWRSWQRDMPGLAITPAPSGFWTPVFPWSSLAGALPLVAGELRITRTAIQSGVSNIALSLSTTTASAVARLVVYADANYNRPAARQFQSANIDCSASPLFKQVAVSLDPGFWWIGVQNIGSVTLSPSGASGSNIFNPGSLAALVTQSPPPNAYYLGGQGATPPDPCPSLSSFSMGTCPMIWIQ